MVLDWPGSVREAILNSTVEEQPPEVRHTSQHAEGRMIQAFVYASSLSPSMYGDVPNQLPVRVADLRQELVYCNHVFEVELLAIQDRTTFGVDLTIDGKESGAEFHSWFAGIWGRTDSVTSMVSDVVCVSLGQSSDGDTAEDFGLRNDGHVIWILERHLVDGVAQFGG